MPQAHLRLRLLGPFTVEGELLAPMPVGKAERALSVLAERAGDFVSVGALVEALWDGSPPERADRNVAALISRLRRALGRDRIDGTAAGYRLVLDHVSIDLDEAVELVETAERELGHGRFALASTSAEQATRLLDAGVALAGERDDRWVHAVRRRSARWLRRARICWSAAALELGAPEVAVEVAGAALRTDPLDEEACRAVMCGHHRSGRPAAALTAYQQLALSMSEQLGSDPSPATRAVHDAIRRARDPAKVAGREPAAPVPAEPVGRDAELAVLRELWAGAAAGTPALVVVTGETGIGKSTLLEHFAAEPRRAGALVLQVACFEAERSLYLEPLVHAVRTIVQRIEPAEVRELAGSRLGTLAQLVPELGDVVAAVDYERAGPELEHGRSIDAFTRFFNRLSARRPVLLIVEDTHHAGRSTIEALRYLADHWADNRIMIVVTERTSQNEPVAGALRTATTEWFELGPLDVAAVAELVTRSGLAYDPEQLHAWTGGSPLFVTELLRQPAPTGAGQTVMVPRPVHDAVAERIVRAGEDAALLLGLGAVLGTSFSLQEVAGLSGLDVAECTRLAQPALRAGLLLPRADGLRFANDIVRRVAYESAPQPVQASRHRRAARLLDDRPEAAARHYAAVGDWSSAAAAWMAAAHTALLTFDNTEAAELLTHAVGAARSADDVPQLVEVLLRRGRASSELGRYEAARADHEHALELARAMDDSELEARVLEQLGWTALHARDALAAVDLAEQATELAESAATAPGALPSALLLLGRVRHWDGDYAGAATAYDQVLAAEPGESTRAVALAYRGALLQHLDRFAEAKTVLARAATLCRRTGEFRPLLQTLFFTGLARGDSGDFAGALRALDSARRLIDAENLGFYRAGIETTTSWIWQELGQPHRAREHAEHAVELARRGGGALELEQELHALLAVADCDLLLGRDDDAAAAVEAAAPMLDRSLPFRPRALLRLVEMRSRWDRSQAEFLLTQARRYSSRKYEALALDALGRPQEAALAAVATGSDLLVGRLGPPAERRGAVDRIVAAVPVELRAVFTGSGRLLVPATRTR